MDFLKATSGCNGFRSPGCNNTGYVYGGIPPKGSDASFNSEEDFAESFAALIYPDEAKKQIDLMVGESRDLKSLFNYKDYSLTPRAKWMTRLIQAFTK